MSGHSKWAQIKRKKEVTDKKRGKLFSKLSKIITVAAKNGTNPDTNFKLRLAIDQARGYNLPADNIKRALEKATGGSGKNFEDVLYEAYGQGGAAILVIASTDNKNRTVSELKKILQDFGGRLAETGSVAWMFKEQGVVVLPKPATPVDRENLELRLIDLGALDVVEDEQTMAGYFSLKDFNQARRAITEKIISAEVIRQADNLVEINEIGKEKISKLIEALEEQEDVDNVFTNISNL